MVVRFAADVGATGGEDATATDDARRESLRNSALVWGEAFPGENSRLTGDPKEKKSSAPSAGFRMSLSNLSHAFSGETVKQRQMRQSKFVRNYTYDPTEGEDDDDLRVSMSNLSERVSSALTGETVKQRQLRQSKFVRYEPEDESLRFSDLQDLRLSNRGGRVAFITLWNNQSAPAVDPNLFLQAGIEILAVTMIICFVITGIFNQESFVNNALIDRLGYNGIYFGFDKAPASAVGLVGYVMALYCNIRFVLLNNTRMQLLGDQLSDRVHAFGSWTSKFFALATIVFPLIFVFPPTTSVYLHSLPLLMYIISCALVVLGRYIMFIDELPWSRVIYVAVYCTVSFILPIVVLGEFITYNLNGGHKSSWPYWITMIVDYSWFTLYALMPFMLPRDIELVLTFELGERG